MIPPGVVIPPGELVFVIGDVMWKHSSLSGGVVTGDVTWKHSSLSGGVVTERGVVPLEDFLVCLLGP